MTYWIARLVVVALAALGLWMMWEWINIMTQLAWMVMH